MPLKLNSSGGGSVTLDVPSTASNFTATIPANTGTVVTTGSTSVVTQGMLAGSVAGNGPAFWATGSGQSISSVTFTVVTFGTKVFDTANAFSTSTNRFTPQVAGYYQFNYGADVASAAGGIFCEITKNGSRQTLSTLTPHVPGLGTAAYGSSLLYMNGTTDYAEVRVYQNSGGTQTTGSATFFSGFLARAA